MIKSVSEMSKIHSFLFLLDPIQEQSTIYEAFVAKEKEKRQEKFVDKLDSKEAAGRGIAEGAHKKKIVVKNGKKPEDKRKRTFEEAMKEVRAVDPTQLHNLLIGIFPSFTFWSRNQDLWENIECKYHTSIVLGYSIFHIWCRDQDFGDIIFECNYHTVSTFARLSNIQI